MSQIPRVRLAVGLAALISFHDPGTADEKDTSHPVRETATATIVEIPVNVIGNDGKRVAGLTAADFELYDDDKKQAISGMEVVDLARFVAASAPGTTLSPSQTAARRHWLIVFDLSYTSLSGLLRARDGAQGFVAKAMKDSDLAAVATLSVDTGWKLLVNFTADRAQLAQAIDTLGLPGLAAESADPLGFAFAPPGQNIYTFARGRFDGDINDTLKDLQTAQKPATDDLARGRLLQLLKSLGMMGRTLDAVRGRKHVLFFSEGFETRLLSGNAADKASGTPYVGQQTAAQDAATASVEGEIWKVDSDARFGSTSTRSSLTEALVRFRRSDTILHTIDIGGLRTDSDASSSAKSGSGTDALYTLAAETNGEFVRNANQLGGEIEKLVERTDLVYLLVYEPKSLARPGAFHQLRVKVNAPGAKVVARAGYYEPRPYASLSPIERVLLAGDAITGGLRENAFATAVLCAPFPAGGSLSQVPVVLEIPGGPLLKDDTAERSRVQVFIYATDASGTLMDYVTQEVGLDLTKLRSRLEAGGVKFLGTLGLPPGDYTVRTLVRNGATGHSAVTATSLKVNAVPGATAVVLPPLFREATGRWVIVKANPRIDSPIRHEENPFSIESEAFIPAAMPSMDAETTLDVVVTAFNLGSGRKPEPLQVSAEIVGSDGRAQAVDLKVVRRLDHQRAEGRVLLLSFKPIGLAAGRYALKVRVSDRATKKGSEASAGFEVGAPKS